MWGGEADLRRDGVDTSVLDGLPSLLPDALSDLLELLSGRFTSPVRLDGLMIEYVRVVIPAVSTRDNKAVARLEAAPRKRGKSGGGGQAFEHV